MPNFIRHFNTSCETFANDRRITSSHLALYMSLFYHWNKKRFAKDMPISRDDIMLFACIGAFNTYYRCLHELHLWGYMIYTPSHHPNIPSRVTILDIAEVAGSATLHITPDTTGEPEVIPLINTLNVVNSINETKGKAPALTGEADHSGTTRHSRPVDLKEAADYFREQHSTVREAEKFFHYYQGNGWQLGGRTPIKDWHATARSWILKADEFNVKETKAGPKANHLDTDNDKDFAEPI